MTGPTNKESPARETERSASPDSGGKVTSQPKNRVANMTTDIASRPHFRMRPMPIKTQVKHK